METQSFEKFNCMGQKECMKSMECLNHVGETRLFWHVNGWVPVGRKPPWELSVLTK